MGKSNLGNFNKFEENDFTAKIFKSVCHSESYETE